MANNKDLYSRLKRLFSTNVIVRQLHGTNKLRVIDTDHLQGFISRSMMDKYARLHASYGPNPQGRWEMGMAFQGARLQLFRDYDVMDNNAIIASALNIYADECTTKNEYGEILTIESSDSNIRDVLHNLFYDILNIEFNLWPWVRNMCKYGDFFLFLEISEEYGIHNVLPLSVYDTVRIEGEDPKNPYYVQFKTTGMQMPRTDFENFEIAHFRLLSDTNFAPYGKAMIEGARRTYKQLSLLEDAMIVHRLMRAPDRRIFKIDIGNIPAGEVDNFIQQMATKMKRQPLIDPTTGDYNLKFSLQNIVQDFYIPVRGKDSGTSIENLSGLEFNATDDVEYLRNLMMAALQIPKGFLGYAEEIGGKSTLSGLDVRFSRTIERLQRIIVSELQKIATIHLYAQGHRDESLVNFTLSLTNPSTIQEQEKLNIWQQKFALAGQAMQNKTVSTNWVYENVFEMTEDQIRKEREEILEDTKFQYRLQQLSGGGLDPAKYPLQSAEIAQNQGQGQGNSGQPKPGGALPSNGPLPPLPPSPEQKALPPLPPPTTSEGLILDEDELFDDLDEGRKKKGMVYGQDSHPAGRDPLGGDKLKADRHLSPKRRPRPEKAFKIESLGESDKSMFKLLDNFLKKTQKTMLNEQLTLFSSEDSNTYMDETILLSDEPNDVSKK